MVTIFFQTSMGMDQVVDPDAWNPVANDTEFPNPDELIDVDILRSAISYITKSYGLNNFLDFFGVAKIEINGKLTNMTDYFNNFFPDYDYISDIKQLFTDLSGGARYNILDSLIALYAFTINKMIQNQEEVDKIYNVAHYFQAIVEILDSLLFTYIVPFIGFTSDNDTLDFSKFSYLQRAFQFYDDKATSGGRGIAFQKEPFSYYRKLLGNGEDKDAAQQKIIFNLLKAAMGAQSIMMNGLSQNQEMYQKWLVEYKAKYEINKWSTLPLGFGQKDLEFTNVKSDDKLLYFTFSNHYHNMKRENFLGSNQEWYGIWANFDQIYAIDENLKIGNFDLTAGQLLDNAQNYINSVLNSEIQEYRNSLLSSVNQKFRGQIENPIGKNTEEKEQQIAQGLESLETLNTINYIHLGTPIFEQEITTNTKKFLKVVTMIKDAVKPLEERLSEFYVQVMSMTGEIALSIPASGVMAEKNLINKGMINNGTKMQDNLFKNNNQLEAAVDYFINNVVRSQCYINFTRWIYEVKTQFLSDDALKNLLNTAFDFIKKGIGLTVHLVWIYVDLFISAIDYLVKPIVETFVKVARWYFNVQIEIAKNVLPGFKYLMWLFENFNYDEQQTYKFALGEAGTELYWDGGLVHYSWWGIMADQKYSINDLKMINPREIISGYNAANSGFYYGGKMHADLNSIKYDIAQSIINNALRANLHRLNEANYLAERNLEKVYWKIKIKDLISDGETSELYAQDLDTIAENAAHYGVSSIPKTIYKTAAGLVTCDEGEYQETLVNEVLDNLKNILIIRLPNGTGEESDQLLVPDQFELPCPRWSNGFLEKGINKNPEKYIIFDPNLDSSNLDSDFHEIMSQDDKETDFQKAFDALKAMANQDYELSKYKLHDLLVDYTNFDLPEKHVIFEELNNPQKKTYESLDGSWIEESFIIYYFVDIFGTTRYYTKNSVAKKNLISADNYDLKISNFGKRTTVYKFKGLTFNSINEIYDLILEKGERGFDV